jgi:predicted secreted Zn-dependent protease
MDVCAIHFTSLGILRYDELSCKTGTPRAHHTRRRFPGKCVLRATWQRRWSAVQQECRKAPRDVGGVHPIYLERHRERRGDRLGTRFFELHLQFAERFCTRFGALGEMQFDESV